VAFVDANTGYIPIDENGVGTSIQKSTDGGVTWSDDETSEPFALLLLDIAANNNNVAVIGALSLVSGRINEGKISGAAWMALVPSTL